MIHPARIQRLNDAPERPGRYVLYWMQQAQRSRFNHALEYAVQEANRRGLGTVVAFGLTESYPEANARHYVFMLEGLREVAKDLDARHIKFVMRRGSPDQIALDLAGAAAVVVCDRGYLRHQKSWRTRVASRVDRPMVEIESDVIVPLEIASTKQEIGARTLRPKIHRAWDTYLVRLPRRSATVDSRRLRVHGDLDPADPQGILRELKIDRSVAPVRRFRGGAAAAKRRLGDFVAHRLAGYGSDRNEPADWHCSLLSPYLHFGQISPLEIALRARLARQGSLEDRAAFLEELIVRRELAMNFVHYNRDYDSYDGVPSWAQRSLAAHRLDHRPTLYTRAQLESAETHDPYWNAAMREMVHTGFMHNYMRMYWGKKILEWSKTPEAGFRTALHLNNKYFLDGRDANSFAGVAWCFGLHDRPWVERPIFGTVRYMNDKGLERKFDIERYVERVDELVRRETE